jgi:DnaJ-class molecular chaperone
MEKPPPCRACGEARTAAENQAANQAAAKKRALTEAWDRVRNCPDCKGTGQIDVDNNAVKHCHCRERITA